MMGTALIDLYSSSYKESTSRKSGSGSNDGNGKTSTIVKNNKKSVIKDKKVPSLHSLLFDSNQNKVNDANYHSLSGFTNGELLVNIKEEEEQQQTQQQQKQDDLKEEHESKDDQKRPRSSQEFYKSSSDGYKMRPLISQAIPTGGSMQILNNSEARLRQNSGSQFDFGKVIARFPMIYLGQKFLDKKYTLPMLPWLIAEYRREVLPIGSSSSPNSSNSNFNSNSSTNLNHHHHSSFGLHIQGPSKKERKRIWFEITDRCVMGFDRDQCSGFEHLNRSLQVDNEKEAFSRMNALNEGFLFLHKNNWICKIQTYPHEDGNLFCFAYLTRDFGSGFGQNNENKPYTLHIFECDEKQLMTDSIEIIKSVNHELQRCDELGMSSADSLPKKSDPNSLDNILSSSQQYEVMYLGKLRLAQKRALPSFIDETVDSWKKEIKQPKSEDEDKMKNETNKSSDMSSIIPILSIDNEATTAEQQQAAEDDKSSSYDKKAFCKDANSNSPSKKISCSTDDVLVDQSTFKNKNHLNLPSNHSLITNTQSLDESTRESIISDLKEVNKQQQLSDKQTALKTELTGQLSPKQKAQKINQNLNTIDDHLLTDNLDDLGEIRRTSSAKSSSVGHTSKLNASKLQMRSSARLRSASGDTRMSKQVSLPLYGRPRTGSGGSSDFNRKYNNSILRLRAKNRTMLFLIGRFEICLLSLDNQQILLNKSFNNVTHCSQGVNNPDHFGFICKEAKQNGFSNTTNANYRQQLDDSNSYLNASNSSSSSCLDMIEQDNKTSLSINLASNKLSSTSSKLSSSSDLTANAAAAAEADSAYHYVGYIFKGESEKLVNEVMYSIRQAFHNAHQAIQQSKTRNNVFCSECPLGYFNQLCIELQDVSVEKAQCIILTKIGELTANEHREIMSGYEGVQVNCIREQNEILMSLLKRFYEKKQLNKHPICKKETSNNVNRNTPSTLDNFRQRAKKSLSTSFETILKLRHTDSNTEHLSENLAKLSKELRIQEKQEYHQPSNDTTRSTSNTNLSNLADGDHDENDDDQPRRRRSSTISGADNVHREMTDQDSKNNKINKADNKKAERNRKNQLHSASFTSSGNRDSLNYSLSNKSESLPPKSPLFKIFNQISQNKSGNTSEENLGNSSSSSSSNVSSNVNVNQGSSPINKCKSNDALEKRNFRQTSLSVNNASGDQMVNNPDSILKQPNKQPTKQRSLEKTIEFASSVTCISDSDQKQEIHIRDSDEEKDMLYDENGVPYQIEDDDYEENNTISWRKQIFSNIHSSTRHLELGSSNDLKSAAKNVTFDSTSDLFKSGTRRRTREELRELWRKAINQQIVLIKMEKENLILRENQHEAEDKRLKLDYEDLIACTNVDQWTQILERCAEYAQNMSNEELVGNFDCFGNTQNFNLTKYSSFLNSAVTPIEFSDAIQNGCPKNRRGEIWCLLADIRQRNGVRPVCSPAEASVDFNTNYRVLLQQLTSINCTFVLKRK